MGAPEAIIIGSGFSGASAAAALAERGCAVTVIERGPWRRTDFVKSLGVEDAAPFPRGGRMPTGFLRSLGGVSFNKSGRVLLNRNGLFDVFLGDGLDVIGSASVGGNSHVYGGISMRPVDRAYWDNAGEGLSAAAMETDYEAVERLLKPRSVGPEALGAAALAKRFPSASKLITGADETALSLAINDAPGGEALTGRGGLFGCIDGSKRTVDEIFLGPHLRSGKVRVLALHEVEAITREDSGYALHVRDLKRGKNVVLKSGRIVLAGGAFNTVSLLLKSRERGLRLTEALGCHFGGNGDTAGIWSQKDDTDLTAATPTLQRVRLKSAPDLDIVEGAAPFPAFMPAPGFMTKGLSRTSLIAGMGKDKMNGEVSIADGRVRLSYNPDESPIIRELEAAFDEIARETGTKIEKPKRLFTVHPTGGAGIGRVVDGGGAVYGCPGLYVADASAFPKPLGSAPSLTIAAWARHVARGMDFSNA